MRSTRIAFFGIASGMRKRRRGNSIDRFSETAFSLTQRLEPASGRSTRSWKNLVSREIGQEVGDRKMWSDAGRQLEQEIAPLKDEIERLVQKRLGYEVKEG